MKSLSKSILIAVFGTFVLSGCVTNYAITETVKAAIEDRLVEEQVVDTKIKVNLLDQLSSIDALLLVDLSVDVWKTNVMITGTLSDKSVHDRVVQAAKKDSRISYIYDDIQMVSKADVEKRRAWKGKAESGVKMIAGVISDVWIDTKILAVMVANKGTDSVNYRWRSVNGNISVLGDTQNQQEQQAVKALIGSIEGVNSLKYHPYVAG